MPYAIQVENLSKHYRLGGAASSSLRETLSGLWRKKAPDSEFWALKDLNFEIGAGEVVGIIGHNGAGKSTLLKVLSRITEPSEGRIRLRGRMASLLEVGTGFHPELSGLENIYLNGSILGMRREEIKRKLDEIIDFSGVERFLHTPVKHYSSGMYVRLAFSVAAHLEPEILIVDEVLAVGDAEFQKRCLGKMQEVSQGHGRTVLFVSHSMSAIENLCPRSMLLEKGQMLYLGETAETIRRYTQKAQDLSRQDLRQRTDRQGEGLLRFTAFELRNAQDEVIYTAISGRELKMRLYYEAQSDLIKGRISLAVKNQTYNLILLSTELLNSEGLRVEAGRGYVEFVLPKLSLTKGEYQLVLFAEFNRQVQDWIDYAAQLEVEDGDFYGVGLNYPQGWAGQTLLTEFSYRQSKLNL